jgi:hypothetical protein
MDQKEIAAAAARALKDATFAQEILEGKHNYPEVREAILKDLEAGIKDAMLKSATSPEQFDFLQTFNPALNPRLLKSYIQTGPKPGGVNLGRLSGIPDAACW